MVILTAAGCPTAAEAVTDKAGGLEIKHMPAGRYTIYMVPKQGLGPHGLMASPLDLVAGDR